MGQTEQGIQHILDVMSATKKRRAPLVKGPPGCGKSQALGPGGAVHTKRAQYLGIDPKIYGFIDYRPALEDPTESKGMPFPDIESGKTTWLLPEWLPTDGFGLLCIEEIGNASKAHWGALYQLVHDRQIKEYHLPEGWDIVATSNRKTDGSGVNRLPAALVGRFNEVLYMPDTVDFTKYARASGMDRRVIAAVNWMPDMIEKFDGTIDGPQSTGRSVEQFSDILQSTGCEVTGGSIRGNIAEGGDDQRVFKFAKGALGEEDAARMVSFLGIFNRMPDVKGILHGKDVPAPVDSDIDVAFAVMSKLAELADRSNIGNVLGWIDKLPNPCRAVFALDIVTMGVGKSDTVLNWISKNARLFS
tara:strand:- start:137 stop:1213 length:1077 start_codon:yes stop_codon:yes gene_type:complete